MSNSRGLHDLDTDEPDPDHEPNDHSIVEADYIEPLEETIARHALRKSGAQ